jgi:CheY-like chemotaxis protein/nitrogen-specific signal transduction histidine kinase
VNGLVGIPGKRSSGSGAFDAAHPEEPVSILAVDDDPQKLLALSALLSELNQEVVTATSGREALRQLLRREFAVILLDVRMPDMDGFETAALIRQRQSTEHTPIIFITSYPDETHASRGYSLGAVDYILAPVEPEVLKAKVLVFAELFRKTAQVRLQARSLERRAQQLLELTQASIAINSALSPDQMLQVVTQLARDILRAQQASATVAVEQKWSVAKTALAVSQEIEALEEWEERSVLRDRQALISFLSRVPRAVRIARGSHEELAPWSELFANDNPARLGWLAAPMTGRDGRPMGLLHVLGKTEGDFTEEDEAVLTHLAQMSSIAVENSLNAEALEANRIKDEFLTTLSHELRTPLSAILGWTRILRTKQVSSDRMAHGLEVIERNVLSQTRLIEDLLDVSRIITGKIRLSIRPVTLSSIVDAAIEAMRPAADAKEIRIEFAPAVAAGEDEAIGDPDRLQQIVWNLVSNAIKFTPVRGRVWIELSRDAAQFCIRVRDTGKGIHPDFLPHVFDRFRQADSTMTRAHSGLGIGLAIARHLVELHGGSMQAESPGEAQGATFTIFLPAVALGVESGLTARSVSDELPGPVVEPLENLEGIQVLVVEDEPDGRELFHEALSAGGARVVQVESAEAALESIDASLPDVLISDLGMPGEDGYSLIRKLRKRAAQRGGKIPAIAVSAYAREEDRIAALAAGFQSHLAKPFKPYELVSEVARLHRTAAARKEPPLASAAGPNEPQSFSVSGAGGAQIVPARVLVIEDDVDLREGLRQLLQIWGHDVDVAESGASGIEKVIENPPRFALIDIGLPEMDGYEVARRIREAFGKEVVFLVAVSGYTGNAANQRALECGFDAQLPKPIDIALLQSLLRTDTDSPATKSSV